VLDEQGRIHAGCNVENAAYPQGWCAETSALAVMVAAGGRRVLAVAVCAVWRPDPSRPVAAAGRSCASLPPTTAPSGSPTCTSTARHHTLGELLPHSFGPDT
jgi:cytidine deaminase